MDKINVYLVGNDTSYTKFLIPKVKLVTEIFEADIVLFTGGEDVSPGYYGEPIGKKTYVNQERDQVETHIFNTSKIYGKLNVGICRGAQFLTVMSNGRLIQDVTGHATGNSHLITIVDENRDMFITSTHHQMMFPFDMNEDEYKIIAKSTSNLSKHYMNGYEEKMKFSKDFIEPEIAYYYKSNSLAIQGHPEYMEKSSPAVLFINQLIEELLDDDKSKRHPIAQARPIRQAAVNRINIEDFVFRPRVNPIAVDPFNALNEAVNNMGVNWIDQDQFRRIEEEHIRMRANNNPLQGGILNQAIGEADFWDDDMLEDEEARDEEQPLI